MKIPTLLMASLLTVGLSAQTTKPQTKKVTKTVKKVKKTESSKKTGSQPITKKDTVKRSAHYCPACGMG